MSQAISLWGANYTDVPALTVPKTGGGTARFDDASVTTATAADVASGKVFLASDGTVTTGTASGGGATNIVQGSFTGTTSGVLSVDLPYTGTGYPIAIGIYVSGGPYNSSSSFYSLVQQYAVAHYQAIKANMNMTPVYAGKDQQIDGFSCVCRYKSSSTSATSYTQSASNAYVVCGGGNPSTTNYFQVVRMPSNKRMKVLISSGAGSVGFVQNLTYNYYVIYSS